MCEKSSNYVAAIRQTTEKIAVCSNPHCRSTVKWDTKSNAFRCNGRNHLQGELYWETRKLAECDR